MAAAGARVPAGGGGGQTRMQNPAQAGPAVSTQTPRQAVLHLRGATREEEEVQEGERRGITWAEDVVDNEGLGRKSSKVCCIYHAPKEFGESSDESSSDSSDSDSGDDGSARPARRQGNGHGHGHNQNHDHDHDHGNGKAKDGKGKGRARSPNAYEKVPKNKSGGAKDKE